MMGILTPIFSQQWMITLFNYIYRNLHGALNSAPTCFLVDKIEKLTFNEDGHLDIFILISIFSSIYMTFMIFREMSRLSDVEDSILVSQTIISQQTGVLFKINQNQFPMVISFNFKKKF